MTSTLDDKSIFQVSTYKGLKIHNFFQIITNLCFDRTSINLRFCMKHHKMKLKDKNKKIWEPFFNTKSS